MSTGRANEKLKMTTTASERQEKYNENVNSTTRQGGYRNAKVLTSSPASVVKEYIKADMTRAPLKQDIKFSSRHGLKGRHDKFTRVNRQGKHKGINDKFNRISRQGEDQGGNDELTSHGEHENLNGKLIRVSR